MALGKAMVIVMEGCLAVWSKGMEKTILVAA